jgi:hypothetical protein
MRAWPVNAVLLWQLVTLAVTFAAPAKADFSCEYDNGREACQPSIQAELEGRIGLTRALFEGNNCSVQSISVSGRSDWDTSPYLYEMGVIVKHKCEFEGQAIARTVTTARYTFACSLREFKYYESGFDYDNDGKRMHWDSQGTSKPLPWRNILYAPNKVHLEELFDIWCK